MRLGQSCVKTLALLSRLEVKQSVNNALSEKGFHEINAIR